MYNFKKLISLAIVLVMVMSVMPMAVSADNPEFTAPTERFFDDYDAETVPDNVSSVKAAEFSIVDDALRIKSTEGYDVRAMISGFKIGSAPIVIEYDMNGIGGSLKDNFYFYADGSARTRLYHSEQYNSINAVQYVMFDPVTGTATSYKNDFTVAETASEINQTTDTFNIGLWFSLNVYTEERPRYFDFDYIAAYDYTEMSIKLENVTETGATLKTTLPIDIANTALNVGGVAVNITKVPDTYNTYNAEFVTALQNEAAYTLSGNIAYLGGTEPYEVSYGFTTPAKTYAAPTERYFNDFEGLTEVPSEITKGSDGVLSIVDGKLHLGRSGGTQARANVSGIPVGSKPIVFEYNQSKNHSANQEGVYISGKAIYSGEDYNGATPGARYVVYYPQADSAAVYTKDFTQPLATKDAVGLTAPVESVTFRFHTYLSNNDRYFEYDYFAAYDLDNAMAIKLEDVAIKGATLKTTIPIDVDSASLSIGENPVILTKVPDTYNTYKLEFANLRELTDYTLSGSFAYLGGTEPYEVSYGFTTPAKTYAAPTERYFNDFEGLTEVPESITPASDGAISIVNGKLHLGRSGGTQARANVSGIPVGLSPVVFEYNQYKNYSVNQEGVYISGKAVYSGEDYNGAVKGARYVIYYPQADSAVVYTKDFTQPLASKDALGLTAPVENVTFRFHTYLNADDRYFEYDYLAAYDLDDAMAIKLENVSVKGAVLKTTIPVDVDTASLNIGGTPVTLTKVPDTYNTYKLEFGTTLSELADYTLSGSLSYLTGTTPYTVNYAFKTPVKTFADFVPYEYYLEDFEGITEIPSNIVASQNGVISLNNGKLYYTTNGEKINNINYDCRLAITDIPTDGKKVIIELGQSGKGYAVENDFYILSNNTNSSANRTRVYKDDTVLNEAKYVVYDPDLNTVTPYINGLTAGETINCVEHTGDKFGIALWATISSTSKYLEYDYIAVYELSSEFMYEIEEVSTLGAVLNTTLPIDIATSEFSLGGIGVKIEKAPNAYNRYNLTFNKEISDIGNYTLTGKIAYLGGSNEVAVSYSFENPVKPLTFTNLAVDESDGVKAVVTATNLSNGRGYDVYLIITAYNSEGEYLSANFEKITVAANAENAVYTAEAPEVEDAVSYRALLWKLQLNPLMPEN